MNADVELRPSTALPNRAAQLDSYWRLLRAIKWSDEQFLILENDRPIALVIPIRDET
jgi:hypothetical protein